MEIKVYTNQGAGPLLGSRKRLQILGTWKLFLSQTTGLNALIFGMKQPWDMETQMCAN